MATSEQLVAILLSDSQDQFARDLPVKLGISQPSFSRLAQNTENVVSYGAKLDKRYTVMEPKFGMNRIAIYQINNEGMISNFGVLVPVRRGRYVFEPMRGSNTIFDGIPWFIDCLRPQGFLGRRFPLQNPDLGLPESIADWSDTDVLKALCSRGEDLPGNLIIGADSVARYLQTKKPTSVQRSDYPELSIQALAGGIPASSAGGEQPKFTCFDGQKYLIVKFSPVISQSLISLRWADLLVCEGIANQVLSGAQIPAAKTVLISEGGRYFLESERFDRTANGRLALIPLASIDMEFVGCLNGWGRCVTELHKRKKVSDETRNTVLVLEMFGKMIGNSDMHFGNLSFHPDKDYKSFSLAPIYDMVPMLFAPTAQGEIAEKTLKLPTPTPDNIEIWLATIGIAKQFWETVAISDLVSAGFREIAARCLTSIEESITLSAFIERKKPK